jgi:tripartite-type tricarboxylate transporter receptor subunit TctC
MARERSTRGPVILIAALVLAVAACAPAAPPSPTAAPAQPAESKPAATAAPAKTEAKPAATTAPAKPAEAKPAASPAAKAEAKPTEAAKPALSKAEGPAAKPAEKVFTRPINWIVPYGSGAFDTLSRGLAPVLSKELGVPVVVENVPGAEGFNRVSRAAPDGHTMGVAELVGEYILKTVSPQVYDISKFTVYGRFNEAVNLVGVSPRAPFKTIEEFRNTKETVRCGLFGGFGLPAAHCFLLAENYNVPYTFVKFPTPAEAILGVTRGDADIATAGTVLWLDHFAKGNAAPLVVWSVEPEPRVPGSKNLKDIGLEELVTVSNQRSILGPPGVPADRVEAMTAALDRAMKSAEFQEFLTKGNWEKNALLGEPFRKLVGDLTSALTKHEAAAKRAAAKT